MPGWIVMVKITINQNEEIGITKMIGVKIVITTVVKDEDKDENEYI